MAISDVMRDFAARPVELASAGLDVAAVRRHSILKIEKKFKVKIQRDLDEEPNLCQACMELNNTKESIEEVTSLMQHPSWATT